MNKEDYSYTFSVEATLRIHWSLCRYAAFRSPGRDEAGARALR